MNQGYSAPGMSQRMAYSIPPPGPSHATASGPHPIHHQYQQHQSQPLQHPARQQHQPGHPLPPPASLEQLHARPHHPEHPGPHQFQNHQPRQPPQLPSNGPSRQDDGLIEDESQKLQRALASVSRVEEASGLRFRLDVVQQPQRARMCGYGDKDRRPITPPPCVRLIITNASGEEINYKDVDHSMFVLNVDLWNEHAGHEVNLCRQPSSTGGPSIPTSTPFQLPPNGGGPSVPFASGVVATSREPPYGQHAPMGYVQPDYPPHQSSYDHGSTSYPPNGTYGPPQQYFPNSAGAVQLPPPAPQTMMPQRYENAVAYTETNGGVYNNDQYKGALNRNLIGSVAASAFCLNDTKDREGIWFVLQDLSVRLEGSYRLKFSFINVGTPGLDRGPATVTKGKAPILASCFSDCFTVFSAKKFPGVCESTALSKTFATQGIKIPIRKDGNKGGDEDEDE